MRCSKQTIILTTCAILVLAACWPMLNLTVMPNAAAQSGAPERARTMKKGELFTELSRDRIESILAEPVPEVSFFQRPLREVLVELKKLTGIDVYFDFEELGDVIDPDVPIDVSVAENSMTFGTLIGNYILAPNDLVYVIRDNHLVIMSYDKHLAAPEAVQIVVYNCRDLLVGIPVRPADAGHSNVSGGEDVESPDGEAAPGGTDPAPAHSATKTENLHQFGMGGGFGAGGFGAMPVQEAFSDIGAREQQLVDVIRMTVRYEDYPWADDYMTSGENVGTVQAINGMLVIRALPEMHDQVRQLLGLLRESTKEKDWPADLGDWPHKKKISPPPKAKQEDKAEGKKFVF